VKRSFPVTLYERHAMSWDQKERSGFVTPKTRRWPTSPAGDPALSWTPTRTCIRRWCTPDALCGPRRVRPVVHRRPHEPFQEFSEKAGAVDYLQFPATRWRARAATATTCRSCSWRAREYRHRTALVDVPVMCSSSSTPGWRKRTCSPCFRSPCSSCTRGRSGSRGNDHGGLVLHPRVAERR